MQSFVLPTNWLHAAFLDCREEWARGCTRTGFGLADDDELDSAGGFAAWVRLPLDRTHPAGEAYPPGPHSSPRWIVEDGRVLGRIARGTSPTTRWARSATGSAPPLGVVASWALRRILLEVPPPRAR